MVLSRRNLLTGGSAALLNGCAGYSGGDRRYAFLTPGSIQRTMQQAYSGRALIFGLNEQRLMPMTERDNWRPDSERPWLYPDAKRRQGLDTIFNSSWSIKFGAHNIAGFKHLYALAACDAADIEFLRVDGVAADPKSTSLQMVDLNLQPFSLGGDILLGVATDPSAAPVGYDSGEASRPHVPVVSLNYPQMVGFVANLAQYIVMFDSAIRPYRLGSTNSNAFLATAMESCLPDLFDRKRVARLVEQQGWNTPGFDVRLDPVPGFKPMPVANAAQTATTLSASLPSEFLFTDRLAADVLTKHMLSPFRMVEAERLSLEKAVMPAGFEPPPPAIRPAQRHSLQGPAHGR